MSTTIDQRVVEMQFDNKHFERNVSTTMSTLDKLKQKLHLDGATKGLENVNAAAKNVNMSSLGNSVEAVQAKFSALQVMGVTALANITNSAVNAGKRMIKALTLDPVTTGFKEYETQINAVQTILANTESKGTTIDQVNQALEELNQYADKTIYNFTEMTRNIGTFTAAGVDLDTSVNAIQGIANLAAVSGSTSQQASTAMYQLSQALSSGTVKLMDWNSVVNAGMGGEVFQNALKETARVHGVAIDDMIKEQGSFRETLSEGWLTSEILTDTLQKFTMTTEGLTDEQIKANREMLKAKGYTDEQIDGIFKLGNTATNAATKVKTFTQLWDVLKESAQSGWSQTWKILIGDFEEAKNLLTPLADTLTGFINKMSNARNAILEKVFGGGRDTKWNSLAKSLDKAGLSMQDLSGASELLTGTSEALNKSLEGTGTYTVKKGDYLDKIAKKYGTTWQEIYKLNQDIIDDPDLIFPQQVLDMPEGLKKTADGVADVTNTIGGLSDAQLKNLGYTDEQIKAWRELEKVAKENNLTIEELMTELSKPRSGRDLLIESFKNLGNGIMGVGQAIKEAWTSIFDVPNSDQIAASIYNAVTALNEFSEKLRLTDEEGKLNENGQKIQRTFKGIFAALDIVLTVVGGPLKIAFKVLMQLLGAFDLNILDITAAIGDVIVKFRDWIDSVLDFTGVFEKIVDPVKNAIKTFREWIDSLKESENLPQDIAKGIASGFGKAVKAVKNFFSKIPEYFSNGFSGLSDSPIGAFVEKLRKGLSVAGQTIKILCDMIRERVTGFLSRAQFEGIGSDSVAGLVQGLKDGASKAWNAAVEMVSKLVQKVKEFLGIHSPSTVMMAIGGFIIAGLVKGIIQGLPDVEGTMGTVVDTLKNIVNNIDLGSMFSAAATTGLLVGFNKIADMFSGVGDMFSGVGDTLSGVGEFLETTASGVNKVLKKSAKGIGKILNNTAKVVKSFSKVLDGVAFSIKADAIKTLGITLLMLVGAIVVLTFFKPAELWNAVGIVAALAAVLGVLAWAISKINTSSASFNFKDGLNIQNLTSGLMGIGIAILLLGTTIKMIGSLDEDQAKQGFLGLAGIVTAIITVVGLFGLMGKNKSVENVGKLGKMLWALAAAILVMAIVIKMLGGMDIHQLIQGGVAIVAFGGIIVGLMAATKLISGSKNVDRIGTALIKIALAIGIMALVANMLGGMDTYQLIQGGVAITAFGGIIVGLMAATKLITGSKHVDKIGTTLLKIALAIGVMGIVVKLLGGIPWYEALQGVLVITALAGVMVGMLFTLNYMSACCKDIDKLGKTLLYTAAAIGILAIVVKVLGSVRWQEALQGVIAVAALAGVMVGLLFTLNYMSACCKDIDKLGKTLLYVAGAIAILGVVAVLLGLIPNDVLVKGTIVVGFLSVFMAALIAATSQAKDCMGNLIVLTVAIAVMAAAVWALSTIDPAPLITATAAIGILIGMFALLVKSTSNAGGALGTLIVMSLAVAAIGTILYLLATNAVGSDVLASAAGLSLLMGVLTGLVVVLSKIKVQVKNATMGALALTLLAVPLLAFVGVLACMQGVNNALSNATVLTLLATAMTLLLIPLMIVGNVAAQALLGVLALTAMAVPLIAFVGVLAVMQGVQKAAENATVLTILATAMTLLLIPLTLIGIAGGAALLGVLALTAMAIPLLAFVGVLAIMQNINNATENVNLLTGLMTTMTNLLVKLAIVGPFALVGVVAITALTAVMVAIGALAIAIGALMEKFPALQDFLNTGLPLLEQLAGSIGTMIGNFIAGFMGGIADILPDIGLKLSMFMINAMPFITGAKMVDESVLAGVGILAGAVLALTAADVISGVASFFSGGTSFATLGAELSAFMISAKPFIDGASSLDPSACDGVKALADAILVLTASNLLDGLARLFGGESTLASLAEQLVPFGKSLCDFATTVSGVDMSGVKPAAEAGKIMAEMASTLPTTGGLWQLLAGEQQSMATFGSELVAFGKSIREFATTVSGVDLSGVAPAAEAGKTMAEMASNLPTTGGLWQMLAGEQSMATFATELIEFGKGIKAFAQNVSGLDLSGVSAAAEAGTALAEMATGIPTSGGLWQMLSGEHSMSQFATGIADFGQGIQDFAYNVMGIDANHLKVITSVGKSLAEMAASIPTSGGLWQAIAGGSSLDTFASQLGSFGKGIASYYQAVKGVTTNDAWAGRDAAISITEIPNPSSLVNAFTNLPDLTAFKSKLYTFGMAINSYSSFVDGMNISAIDNSANGIKSLGGHADKIPKIVNSVCSIGYSLSSFDYYLKTFATAIKNYSVEIAGLDTTAISTSASSFKEIADMVKSLSGIKFDGVSSFANSLGKIGKSGVDAFVDTFNNASDKVNKAGSTMIAKLIDGATSKTPAVETAIAKIASSSVTAIRDKYQSFYSAGSYLVSGFASGISANSYKAAAKAKAMAQAAEKAARDELAINSPSKVFREIGTSVPEGFAMGIDKLTSLVAGSSTEMGQTAIDNVKSAISRITDAVNSDIDTQPTIRPVLDLTNVRAGANTLNGLLNTGSSVGVVANVSRISGMMNSYSQNGANADVVSAIDKLNKKMDNLGNTTYQVNGVTYDDGSNITDAVRTIVRAARIERRT